MPTNEVVEPVGIPLLTYRRWQANARAGHPPKGPWPAPVRAQHRESVVEIAKEHPGWGRKVWATARYAGHRLSISSVLRVLTEAGIADYWSKYEFGWHWSPTANQYHAVTAVELAIVEAESLLGHPLIENCPVDPDTGEIFPAITLVTDNGGPFRSIRFERFIASRPELPHVRTRVRSPGQNGVRERAFQSLKYERLYLEEIHDHLELVPIAETFRVEFNKIRPHEHLSWNLPYEVHTGAANPTIPNFDRPETVPPS